jgi:hypothetical protein
MHINYVANRTSRPTALLRESYREGTKVKKRTIANLSALPDDKIALIAAILRGDKLVPEGEGIEIVRALGHGHVDAVVTALKQLDFGSLIATKPCRERDLVMAMVASRILAPHTKLATVRWWQNSTLPETLGVTGASEDDLYAAMDWLLAQQDRIQKKLAHRHLKPGGLVLYDLSSSYFEGSHCPLAKLGYSRDRKKGTLQVNYGMLTDPRGCPVAISVHEGNVADPVTLAPEIDRLRDDFAIAELVLVGDRGMITQKAVDAIREMPGIDWISALKSGAIAKLVDGGALQLDLFDERNLFEITHADFPGERLVACRNPQLGSLRAHTRESLLVSTEALLEAIATRVAAGKLTGADEIGIAFGKVINRYKVGKHFTKTITDTSFSWSRDTKAIEREAALDGIYVIRTSLPKARMDEATCVRSYKKLAQVERAFRTMKTIDLKVRPIHHRTADRVRAHIFLCMLAYYVEWHMREAWRELLFADEDQDAKDCRDPVAPAKRSPAALAKINRGTTSDDFPLHSFKTLMDHLATVTQNTCRLAKSPPTTPTFNILASPTPHQEKAITLIKAIKL